MRAVDDLTYQEYKEDIEDGMRFMEHSGWKVEQCTDRMTEEDNELLVGASEAL